MKGVVLDIDGVIKRGNFPIPGAVDVISELRYRGLKVVFLSNLSTKSRREYLELLKKLGINLSVEDLVLATSATADYIAKNAKTGRVYVVGSQGLKEEIASRGLRIVNDPEEAEFLVAGSPFDESGNVTEDNRAAFAAAIRALLVAKAKFVAVNPDKLFPGTGGKPIPGTGTFLGAIEAATGIKPIVIGKPSPLIFKMAIERLKVPPNKAIMVGDQIDIDIIPAKKAGLTTALVLTGLTTLEDLSSVPPEKLTQIDYILNHLKDLLKILR
jgi:phosphoglycolate/pyridoxal phosphate phosphatase family enzyme